MSEPVSLSRKAFLTAALELIDANGLGSLTLKGLGQHLGVSHTAIYRYFNDIPGLVAELRAEMLLQIVSEPLQSLEPKARILEFALKFRSHMKEHPNTAPMFVTTWGEPDVLVPPSVMVVEELERLGLRGELLSQGYQALESYVVGGTVWDYSEAPHQHEVRRNRFRLVRHREFDRISRDDRSIAKNSEDAFRLGLECILEGLIARI